jgi:circadian clock protein KaiC
MRSVGINLERWVQKGLLQFIAARPASTGLEGHLATMQKRIMQAQPSVVVVEPITSFLSGSSLKSMLTRLVDFLKVRQITSMFTDLASMQNGEGMTGEGVSSLMDTWILLSDSERNRQRTRWLTIVKSRGMAHSRELRELVVRDGEIDLDDPIEPRSLASRGS